MSVVHCHCSMCRRMSGAAYTTWVCLPEDRLDFLSEPASHRSSATVRRYFCPTCGSNLAMLYEETGEAAVSLGTLDEPTACTADRHIYAEDALPSALCVDPDLPRYPPR